jgi:hypothetical protein
VKRRAARVLLRAALVVVAAFRRDLYFTPALAAASGSILPSAEIAAELAMEYPLVAQRNSEGTASCADGPIKPNASMAQYWDSGEMFRFAISINAGTAFWALAPNTSIGLCC